MLDGPAGLLGWIGFGPLAAAILGWSPLYALFGIRSCVVQASAGLQTPVEGALPAA